MGLYVCSATTAVCKFYNSTVASFTEEHSWKSSSCMFIQVQNLATTNNKSSRDGASTWKPWKDVQARQCTASSNDYVINQTWACPLCLAKDNLFRGFFRERVHSMLATDQATSPSLTLLAAILINFKVWWLLIRQLTCLLGSCFSYGDLFVYWAFWGWLASLSMLNLSNPYESFTATASIGAHILKFISNDAKGTKDENIGLGWENKTPKELFKIS